MSYVSKVPAAVVALVMPLAVSQAQDLLECVDPDVRDGLLSPVTEVERRFTSEMPAILGEVALPGDMRFIGSAISDSQFTAAFKTGLQPDRALEMLGGAVSDAGWTVIRRGEGRSRGGFVAPGGQPETAMFCRGSLMVSALGGRKTDATFVTLTSFMGGPVSICDMRSGAQPFAAGPSFGVSLGNYLPRLELPADAERTPGGGLMNGVAIGAVSSGDISTQTKIVVATAMDTRTLAGFFAGQLDAQNWQRDTEWAGRSSAGSSWTARRADQDSSNTVELAGTLSVVALTDGSYEATFQLTKVN